MNARHIIMTAVAVTTTLSALAWGQKGHDTVAYIAECHLTPTAKSAAEELLGGKSIVYYSNWLDNASHTPEYDYSRTWHYKNIDADTDYDKAPALSSGDIVTALNEQTAILRDNTRSRAVRELALKMTVHLVGDIHQPLHMGHASDLGGNRWDVKWFNKNTNLHSVWDSSLPESGHKWSYTEWQQQIDRATPSEQATLRSGTPDDWARETYGICTQVYDTTPRESRLAYDYIARWTPVVENQWLKGGLRLAHLLNSIFDPEYGGE